MPSNSPIFLEPVAFTPSVAEVCPPGSSLEQLLGNTTNRTAAAAAADHRSDRRGSCMMDFAHIEERRGAK
jgi:hypothetical protein